MSKRRNHDAAFKARVALEALKGEGHTVSEKRIRRLMRLMRPPSRQSALQSPAGPGMSKGFLYLVAIRRPEGDCLHSPKGMDWVGRKVLASRVFNSLEAAFCLEAPTEANHTFGAPEIMNIGQGSQLTSFDWTDRLKRAATKM